MSLLSAVIFWAQRLNSVVEAKQRSLVGRELAWQVRELESINGFSEVEFSVFSQWGDDGIIQFRKSMANAQ